MRRFSPRWSRIDGSKPSKKQIQASREADWLEYLVEWKKFGGWVPALDPSSLNSSRWWVWGWLPIPHSSSVFCVLVLRAFRLKHLTPHRIISVCHCFGLLLRIGDISPWWWSICGCGCISRPRCYLDNLYDLIINICSIFIVRGTRSQSGDSERSFEVMWLIPENAQKCTHIGNAFCVSHRGDTC